ncbi:MAG TPA: cytochrome c biogenesis heme-transporting ATPase CcmA [Caldimonas sp.]|nr:cytochrome c biogenesis heme-transporting ATPase CcmA [Caldimonas sp.]
MAHVPLLHATDLACSRGERPLFEGIDFALDAGEWLHVKGANGSGKTTLLRTLVGLTPPDEGRIAWCGRDIAQDPEGYRREFAYLGHPAALKDDLTAIENLRVSLEIDAAPADEDAIDAALGRMHLDDRRHLRARQLSAGQRRRLLLARLLVRPARLWVLDEPFAPLDAASVAMLGELLQAHLDRGGIGVVTSHQPVPLASSREIAL